MHDTTIPESYQHHPQVFSCVTAQFLGLSAELKQNHVLLIIYTPQILCDCIVFSKTQWSYLGRTGNCFICALLCLG